MGVSIGLGFGSAQASQPVLNHIHYTSVQGYTRVVLTLSRETPHKIFTLPADPGSKRPPRIVIDFSPATLGHHTPRSLSVQDGQDRLDGLDGLLKQVRTGQFDPTTTRVVLDVERLDEHHAFALHSPYRLVLDIRGRVRGPRPAPPVEAMQRFTIMLDPGHGGKDPGALGQGRAREKNIVLSLSKRLAKKLETRLPVEVLFTRTDDTYIPLEERTARANATGADLFISLHVNASDNREAHGIETYYLNNTEDRATIRLASLENGLAHATPTLPSQRGLSYILSDLIQTGKEEESISLAHHLQRSVVARAKKRNPNVRDIGVKKGPFYVLVGAHMPCVLVEAGFITNTNERRWLLSDAYQEDLAEGLFLGVERFLREQQEASL